MYTNHGVEFLVDEDIAEKIKGHKWALSRTGYVCRGSKENGKGCSVFLHVWIMGKIPGMEVDHRDRNKLNNLRSNLRHATRPQNAANIGARRRNKLGIKGVHFDHKRGKFCAELMVEGKRVLRKRFDSLKEAVQAHKKASLHHSGQWSYYATNS